MKTKKLCSFFRDFRRDAKGSVLVYSAFAITGLLGMAALSVDVGVWYSDRRTMQSAADSAAMAAAFEIKARSTPSEIQQAAEDAAALNGFEATKVTLISAPTAGDYAGKTNAVEVTVRDASTTFLSSVVGFNGGNVAARAVGLGGNNAGACLVALNPTDPNSIMVNNGTLTIDSCDIHVNSDDPYALNVANGSSITMTNDADACVNGGYKTSTGTYTPYDPRTGCIDLVDPLLGLAEPTPGLCNGWSSSSISNGDHVVLDPGTYCNEIDLKKAASAHFNPGLYILKAGINIQNEDITGTGITLYFTDDAGNGIKMNQDASITISAPVTDVDGGIPGVLIFMSRTANPNDSIKLNGAGTLWLEGAVYLPKNELEISAKSGTSTSPYTFVIADSMSLSGGGNFSLGGWAGSGTGVPLPADIAELRTPTRLAE